MADGNDPQQLNQQSSPFAAQTQESAVRSSIFRQSIGKTLLDRTKKTGQFLAWMATGRKVLKGFSPLDGCLSLAIIFNLLVAIPLATAFFLGALDNGSSATQTVDPATIPQDKKDLDALASLTGNQTLNIGTFEDAKKEADRYTKIIENPAYADQKESLELITKIRDGYLKLSDEKLSEADKAKTTKSLVELLNTLNQRKLSQGSK